MNQVEIIARYLCRFCGEDPDAAMNPDIGFRQSAVEDRTADDNCPRWRGFTGPAEELWALIEAQPEPRQPSASVSTWRSCINRIISGT
jgi:hypothetical protein